MQLIKRPGRYAALAAGYYDDPAVIAAGPDAEILYIRMISWCAMHPETDGIIPLEVAKNRLGFTDSLTRLEDLEANSLVTVDDTTVTITSWIRWNGSWSEIKAADDARKASARERKARQRARTQQAPSPKAAKPISKPASKPISKPMSEPEAPEIIDATIIEDTPAAEATITPESVDILDATIIEPVIIEDKPTDRPDIDEVCQHMAASVEARTGRRPRITKRWQDAARLMIDRDGRTPDQIHAAINWIDGDDFWRANILGMPKLRDKWDTLKLQAERSQKPRLTRAEEYRARQRAEAEALDALWAAQAAQANIISA